MESHKKWPKPPTSTNQFKVTSAYISLSLFLHHHQVSYIQITEPLYPIYHDEQSWSITNHHDTMDIKYNITHWIGLREILQNLQEPPMILMVKTVGFRLRFPLQSNESPTHDWIRSPRIPSAPLAGATAAISRPGGGESHDGDTVRSTWRAIENHRRCWPNQQKRCVFLRGAVRIWNISQQNDVLFWGEGIIRTWKLWNVICRSEQISSILACQWKISHLIIYDLHLPIRPIARSGCKMLSSFWREPSIEINGWWWNHPNNGRAGKHIINNNNWLVVLAILKNMKVNGKDDIPYIMEKTFQPTNHIYIYMTF